MPKNTHRPSWLKHPEGSPQRAFYAPRRKVEGKEPPKVPEGSWWACPPDQFADRFAQVQARMRSQRPELPSGGVFGGEK